MRPCRWKPWRLLLIRNPLLRQRYQVCRAKQGRNCRQSKGRMGRTGHNPPVIREARMRLDPLFRPRSIAIVGASEKPTIGRRLIASLDRIGFSGQVFPLNPNYASVLGRDCYPSFADLPEAPDVAAFCVGHRLVLDAFTAAAERGIRGAVIYDGGFAERGEEGRQLQQKIADICREAGIALCGPNCMGILNPVERNTTYLQEVRDPEQLAGNVGILSQSGGFCVSLLTDVSRFGFSHIVSCGNEAVLNP